MGLVMNTTSSRRIESTRSRDRPVITTTGTRGSELSFVLLWRRSNPLSPGAEVEVEQHRVHGLVAHQLESRAAVARPARRVTAHLERSNEHLPIVRAVVDDEDVHGERLERALDHRAEVRVSQAVAEPLDAANGPLSRYPQPNERQARDDAGTVPALPAGNENSVSEPDVLRHLLGGAADAPARVPVGRGPVVERHVHDHRVAGQVRLVLLGGEDDDVEGKANARGRRAPLREPAVREEVRVVGHQPQSRKATTNHAKNRIGFMRQRLRLQTLRSSGVASWSWR